jgi:hypothetical protein
MFRAVANLRWILSLGTLVSTSLAAQGPDRVGDSTVVAPTYAAMRVLYDSANSPAFLFLAGNVLEIPGANATEIQATFLKGNIARVVAGTWGNAGKYGVEFYFQGDSLLFSFESFEYIAETAPVGQWQNFKRLPAWERRVFWKGRAAAFTETSGCSAQLTSGERERLLLSAQTVREMMRSRAPRT